MSTNIRQYTQSDEDRVVELSLRAWEPVFESMKRVLGPEIFKILYPDWRADQAKEVRHVLADSSHTVWVGTSEGVAVGFVAATLYQGELVGKIRMLAVDPDHQQRGIGAALTKHATEWLRGSGMRVAVVETGGDPGHAPARRTYEKAAYVALPIARYFRAL